MYRLTRIAPIWVWIVVAALAVPGAFLLALRPASSSGAGTLATENVFLVILDGIRAEEAFDHPSGGNPHPVIPRMYDELRPQGALMNNMRNRDYTKTLSSLANILTGRWNIEPNRGVDTDPTGFRDSRAMWPTLIEHYRKNGGKTADQVLFFPSKHNERALDTSFHPAYGASYAPSTTFFDPRIIPYKDENEEFIDDENTDDLAYQALLSQTAYSPAKDPSDYPSLVVLALGITDNSGHNGDYDLHLDVIRNADDVVGDLWQYIESHPHYSGKSTLFVTTDHGRHVPKHGDFTNHTGGCTGCRKIFALCLGPDTTPGLTVGRRVLQTGIAPTLARFLDIDMPYSTGRAIYEVLGQTAEETRNDTITQLSMAPEQDNLYMAYRQSIDGEVEIVFRKAVVDGVGIQFDDPLTITSEFPTTDFLPKHPSVGVNDKGLHVTWLHHLGQVSSAWKARIATSFDLGESFQASKLYLQEILEDENGEGYRVPAYPHMVSGSERDLVVIPFLANGAGDELLLLESEDGFDTQRTAEILETSGLKSAYFRSVDAVTFSDGSLGVAYVRGDLVVGDDPPIANWEVYYERVFLEERIPGTRLAKPRNSLDQPSLATRITSNQTPSLQAQIALDPSDDRHIIVAFTDFDSGDRSQVHMRESFDRGVSWSTVTQVTTSTVGAWNPSIAIDDSSTLYIAYVDHDTGSGDIQVVTIDSVGTMSAPLNVSNSAEVSTTPTIAITENHGAAVVWTEANDTILGAKVP